MTKSTGNNASKAAVLVSYRLQLYTVAAAFAVMIAQTLMFIFTFGLYRSGPSNFSYLLPLVVGTSVFPAVVFVAAYLTSGRYPAAMSRWFIAVLKTLIVLVLYGLLQSVWQLFISAHMYQPGGDYQGPPPNWVTSNIPNYAFMILSLLAMFLYIYVQHFRKRK